MWVGIVSCSIDYLVHLVFYSPVDADWDLVTCYCQKPYAGRDMIECDTCETWVHYSCAKIRKTNVPEVFNCQKCRYSKDKIRKSNRARAPKKQFKELYEDS